MDGYVIVFRLSPRTKNTTISKFCQQFYGQETSSWKGKYHYHRHGLLDDIPYRKLIRGVIIIKKQYLETILEFLNNYDVEVHVREIKLTKEDRRILRVSKK